MRVRIVDLVRFVEPIPEHLARDNNQHLASAVGSVWKCGSSGESLEGFAETHVVGEDFSCRIG